MFYQERHGHLQGVVGWEAGSTVYVHVAWEVASLTFANLIVSGNGCCSPGGCGFGETQSPLCYVCAVKHLTTNRKQSETCEERATLVVEVIHR